jgi:hypothetical protein
MIRAGAASYLGLSRPTLLRADEARATAPAEVRVEFGTIPTAVPGVRFGEHLPKSAARMHRCTLVRSMYHTVNNAHAAAVYCALTGHDRGEVGGGARPDDHPCVGAVLGTRRPPDTAVVPHVLLPFITKEGAGGPPQPGFFGGWLGKMQDPLVILKDPNAADFALPELRACSRGSGGLPLGAGLPPPGRPPGTPRGGRPPPPARRTRGPARLGRRDGRPGQPPTGRRSGRGGGVPLPPRQTTTSAPLEQTLTRRTGHGFFGSCPPCSGAYR